MLTSALVAGFVAISGRAASLAVATDANILVAINARSNLAVEPTCSSRPARGGRRGRPVPFGLPARAAVPCSRSTRHEGTVVDRIPVGGEPGSLVSGGGALWVAGTMGATVERIDPGSATVTWTAHLAETGPVAMAYGDGGLWVADATDQAVVELSPLSGSVLRTYSLDVQPTVDRLGRRVGMGCGLYRGDGRGDRPWDRTGSGYGERGQRPVRNYFQRWRLVGRQQPGQHRFGGGPGHL